jgi:hypothetical protein
MATLARRGPVPPRTRLARFVVRALVLIFRVLIVGMAAGTSPTPPLPSFLRHEDPTAQVEEDDAP